MTITQRMPALEAWTMFRAEMLGQEESRAINFLDADGFEQYEEHAAEFHMKLAEIGVEAQNEAATIAADNPETLAEIEAIKPYDLTADHYIKVVSLFKGSKYEKLHLSAAFRIQNNELLLDLVKP